MPLIHLLPLCSEVPKSHVSPRTSNLEPHLSLQRRRSHVLSSELSFSFSAFAAVGMAPYLSTFACGPRSFLGSEDALALFLSPDFKRESLMPCLYLHRLSIVQGTGLQPLQKSGLIIVGYNISLPKPPSRRPINRASPHFFFSPDSAGKIPPFVVLSGWFGLSAGYTPPSPSAILSQHLQF